MSPSSETISHSNEIYTINIDALTCEDLFFSPVLKLHKSVNLLVIQHNGQDKYFSMYMSLKPTNLFCIENRKMYEYYYDLRRFMLYNMIKRAVFREIAFVT